MRTNDSERDILNYMKKPTATSTGNAAYTFISLKKTCRKLGLSFWDYLNDHIAQANRIPFLSGIIETGAAPA